MAIVPELLKAGCRVVDLSADYRFNDPAVYEKWYGHTHTDPGRLGKTVYGLPELFRRSDSVRRPGCQSRLLHEHVDSRTWRHFCVRD